MAVVVLGSETQRRMDGKTSIFLSSDFLTSARIR